MWGSCVAVLTVAMARDVCRSGNHAAEDPLDWGQSDGLAAGVGAGVSDATQLPHTLRCSPLFYNNWSTVRGFAQIERRNIPVKDSITSKATFRFTEGLGYELRPVGAN